MLLLDFVLFDSGVASFVSLLGGMAHLLFDQATVLTSRVGLLGLCFLVVNVLLASQIRPLR